MRSSLATLAAVFAALFLAVTLWRAERSENDATTGAETSNEGVTQFWQTYEEATRARADGEHLRAAALYREALDLDPRHEDASFYLAVSLMRTGAYGEAAEILRRLTNTNPSSARAWSQLGTLLSSRAPGAEFDPDGAAEAIQRSEALNPEHSGPFLSRGKLALELGDEEEALRAFRIAADMGSPEGAFEAGLVAYRSGAFEEAVASFRRVLDTSARERRIARRGATSEGDVASPRGVTASELDDELTPLESARIKALCFLYWTAREMGGYPRDVPEADRIVPPVPGSSPSDPRLRVHVTPAAVARAPRVPEGIDFEGTVVDVAVADIEGDGDDDVFVLGWKTPGRLFRNDGARFEDVTASRGLRDVGGNGLSALFFDFEGDEDPDLLVTAHAPLALSLRRLLEPERRARPGPLTPRLFRNDGPAGFVEITAEAGLDRHYGVVQAKAHDLDGDGLSDLLFAMGGREANHVEPSLALRNRDGKRFEAWAYLPSMDEPERSLGLRVAEDGLVELLVAEPTP